MKEQDIRPEKLFNRYLELSAEDATRCFKGVKREKIPCVACGYVGEKMEFEKNGFSYSSCEDCGSLFQTPRPLQDAFENFYRYSVSSRFWAEQLFPAVAESRRELIFRPRVEKLSSFFFEEGLRIERLVDVGAGYGIMLDEWRRLHPETSLLAIEPFQSLASECRSKGFEVVEDIAENVSGYQEWADLVVCFEVLEHVFDPHSFIDSLKKLVRPGGYLFISTLGVDGFDIKVLWEKSKSIFPPHHINFMSIVGFQKLFERSGFEKINVKTPGLLDVDIVRNAFHINPKILDEQRFIRSIILNDETSQAFQLFLSQFNLSSHTWVTGKKVER